MTHPAHYHTVDLSLTPTQAAATMPHAAARDLLRNKRRKLGVTRDELLREQIEPLIMRHGVTIDECAEKFDLTPERVCRVMGWT